MSRNAGVKSNADPITLETLADIARRMALANGRNKTTSADVAAALRAYARAWALVNGAPDTVPAVAMEIALGHYRRTAAAIGGDLESPMGETIALF